MGTMSRGLWLGRGQVSCRAATPVLSAAQEAFAVVPWHSGIASRTKVATAFGRLD